MKKIISVSMLFILAFCLNFSFSVSANGVGAQFPIIDEGNVLSDEEFSEIEARFVEIREQYVCDIAAVIVNEPYADTAQQAADNIYDYGDYGVGENYDGILFYICLDTREYHFTTCGDVAQIFNDNALIYIEDNVIKFLKEDDFYKALKNYADIIEEVLTGSYAYNSVAVAGGNRILLIIGFAVLISLIIAFIATFIQVSKMKTALEQDNASDYMKKGSFNLTGQGDIFLYSHIDRREKPKNKSSTHISSSGRSHGGRGGSF